MKSFQSDCEENELRRKELYLACDEDAEIRARTLDSCRRDIRFWINYFAWTKDPRKPHPRIAFFLYPYEVDAIADIVMAIENGEDLLIEKTRDMGASWMVLYVFTWYWLFVPNSDFRVGSRKEDFVDKIGDMDTLLEKVRFCLASLPIWMLPEGFQATENATYMKIINPANKNAIMGESANIHFGSGGRRKALLLDEFAKWEISVANGAWTSTADVTKCRIVASTPVGSGNKFAELARGTKERIKKLTLHWTLHPEKNVGSYYVDGPDRIPIEPDKAFDLWHRGLKVRSPWYDLECERRSEADIAQELDINYLKSGYPFFNIEALRKQKAWKPLIRRLPGDPIPHGSYIRGKIREIDGKFDFFENDLETWVRLFEMPKGYMQYAVGADTSEGLAKGDEAFAVVREKYGRNVVATIKGLIPPDTYARYLWLLAKFYNDADLAPENNNMGYAVCKDLELMGCKLYYTPRMEQSQDGDTKKRGFTTSAKTRPLMLAQAEEEVRLAQCEIRDPDILSQMETFVRDPNTGTPRADGMFLDDGVMAYAICGQVITEKPLKVRTATDGQRADLIAKRTRDLKNGGFRF